MALVVQAHSELEWPKTCSQGPPLVYAGSIILRLSSTRSSVMERGDTNIFLFLLSIFLDFIFLFF